MREVRKDVAYVSDDRFVYVVGGNGGRQNDMLATVECYDTQTNQWRTSLTDLLVFDVIKQSWRQEGESDYGHMSHHSDVVVDQFLLRGLFFCEVHDQVLDTKCLRKWRRIPVQGISRYCGVAGALTKSVGTEVTIIVAGWNRTFKKGYTAESIFCLQQESCHRNCERAFCISL